MNYIKAITAMALTAFLGCNANSANQDGRDTKKNDTVQKRETSVISGTLVGNKGQQLFYQFDNSANTMRIVFDKDTATLKGERMASGIKYSNSVYTYSEWHGNSTLFRKGEKVFESVKKQ